MSSGEYGRPDASTRTGDPGAVGNPRAARRHTNASVCDESRRSRIRTSARFDSVQTGSDRSSAVRHRSIAAV